MADAKHDNNYIHTALVYDGVSTTEPLRVAPATSRLLLDITVVASGSIGTATGAKDSNFIPISYAVTDDAAQTITPLFIDHNTGLLFVDILVE